MENIFDFNMRTTYNKCVRNNFDLSGIEYLIFMTLKQLEDVKKSITKIKLQSNYGIYTNSFHATVPFYNNWKSQKTFAVLNPFYATGLFLYLLKKISDIKLG